MEAIPFWISYTLFSRNIDVLVVLTSLVVSLTAKRFEILRFVSKDDGSVYLRDVFSVGEVT